MCCFVSTVLFYVLFVCQCVLYCCHRVSTQLQLNISYHIISNRYQRVIINSCNNSNDNLSEWKKVQHGVPQGSVLGPLLFILYINDLAKSVSDITSPISFADDTSFIIKYRDETEFKLKVHEILNRINKWLHTNLFMLNCDQTYI